MSQTCEERVQRLCYVVAALCQRETAPAVALLKKAGIPNAEELVYDGMPLHAAAIAIIRAAEIEGVLPSS